MPKTLKQWTVLPHEKLTRVDDHVLTVVGDIHMPLGDFPRRMTVVRLEDARLVIFNAIALAEPEMEALESWGTPTFLIVPSDVHRMDAKIWKDRYPELFVLCPEGARKKVEEVVPVDATGVDFRDPRVQFVAVPGTDEHESALVVRGETGSTLIVNDLIWNLDDRPGFGGWLFRVAGFTGPEPRIPSLVELKGIKNKPALQKQLSEWAELPELQRIIVSHGDVIRENPSGVLRRLAESLA